jgi:hypothetical protein
MKIYKDIVSNDMHFLLSEPMSINFEPPSRFSTLKKNDFKARSLMEEGKESLRDEEEELKKSRECMSRRSHMELD